MWWSAPLGVRWDGKFRISRNITVRANSLHQAALELGREIRGFHVRGLTRFLQKKPSGPFLTKKEAEGATLNIDYR